MLHKNIPLGDIHYIHNWEVANAAALAALTPVAADRGKLAWKTDTNEFFFLADHAGPTWVSALGQQGPQGYSVLSGVVAPTTEGFDGDLYLNTATNLLYGPKAAGVWPSGISLIGPTGATGATGSTGPQGLSAIFKEYASSVERLADVSLVAGNLGYLARQTDDGSTWILLATTPVWASISGLVVTKEAAFSASLTLDTRTAQIFNVTLTGTLTLDLSNGLDGQLVIVRLIQDATGNRTVAFGTSIRVSEDLPNPTLSTAVAKTDYLGFRYNSAATKFDYVGFIKGF